MAAESELAGFGDQLTFDERLLAAPYWCRWRRTYLDRGFPQGNRREINVLHSSAHGPAPRGTLKAKYVSILTPITAQQRCPAPFSLLERAAPRVC